MTLDLKSWASVVSAKKNQTFNFMAAIASPEYFQASEAGWPNGTQVYASV
ncbi:hypothetical protein ACLB1G_21220 [Oxalobacteraceae bacterium A2-2]